MTLLGSQFIQQFLPMKAMETGIKIKSGDREFCWCMFWSPYVNYSDRNLFDQRQRDDVETKGRNRKGTKENNRERE